MERLATGGTEMKNIDTAIKLAFVALLCVVADKAPAANTNIASTIRAQFDNVYANMPPQYMMHGVLVENIDELYKESAYSSFADSVTNDWREILANLGQIATNEVERLLIIGVGLHYDEDFYLDYCSVLCDMHTNGLITAEELLNGRASHRYDLNSSLIRRYQEPKVIEIVNKLKLAMPQQTNYWNSVLSGAAYTNYLEEVAAGLWQ